VSPAADQLLAFQAVSGINRAPALAGVRSAAQAQKAGEDFEAFFLAQMLDQMVAGIPTDGPFGGGSAEFIYRSLLNQEYGRVLSRAGGIGIATQVQSEILKLQEAG